MGILHDKRDRLSITEDLRLGPQAVLVREDPDGTEHTSYGGRVETLVEAKTLAASDSGSKYVLSAAAEFQVTLPVPAPGLEFEFVVGAAPVGGSYTVVTNGSANVLYGTVVTGDVTAVANTTSTPAGDTVTFADGAALVGDSVRLWSDGTSWFVQAYCSAVDGITITQAS